METVLQGRSGETVVIGPEQPFCIIGERINPTGRKTFAEQLRAQIAENRQAKDGPYSTHNEEMEIQKRFSIPVACLVFAPTRPASCRARPRRTRGGSRG